MSQQMSHFIRIIIVDFDDSVALLRIASCDLVATTAALTILSGYSTATTAAAQHNRSFVFMRFLRLGEFVQERLLIGGGNVHVAGQTASLALPR